MLELTTRFNCTELPGGVRVKSVAPWSRLAIGIAAVIIIKALVRISVNHNEKRVREVFLATLHKVLPSTRYLKDRFQQRQTRTDSY